MIWLLCTLFSIVNNVDLPEKPHFSSMEINHIRVATPGLFTKDKNLLLHLDTLTENEYAFPCLVQRLFLRMELGEDIAERT